MSQCAECRWWTRFTRPSWADAQPNRWAAIERNTLIWGLCDRQHQPNALVSTDHSDIETQETFGCIQFEHG